MMQGLIGVVTGRWHRLPLRWKGIVLAVVPAVALLVSATSSYLGNRERERTETDVARTFDLVADLGDLLTLTAVAETGVRGYLLTHRSSFLQPYQRARKLLPRKLNLLHQEVLAEPDIKPRMQKTLSLAHIRQQEQKVMSSLEALRSEAAAGGLADPYPQLLQSKAGMDLMRKELLAMRLQERRLLAARLRQIRIVRQRDYLFIAVTLLLGLAGRILSAHLFNIGVVHRVQRAAENASVLGSSQPLPHAPPERNDALGYLEHQLAEAHQRLRRDG